MARYDAAVIGAGPNGLAAAVELTRNGLDTIIYEANDEIGGGARTAELTLPGYLHDVCSAIHPTGVASPFFREIGLDVEWVHPEIPFAHPLDGGRSVALHRDVASTAAALGEDEDSYLDLMAPFVEDIETYIEIALHPLTLDMSHPGRLFRLGAIGGLPVAAVARRFKTEAGRALFGGVAAHAIAPFHSPLTSAVGLFLGALGHSHGWPMARGGSRAIADALGASFTAAGGEIVTGRSVESLDEIDAEMFFLDVMPPAALRIAGPRLGRWTRRRLERWSPGPGVFKVDWAIDGPIPWADPSVAGAGTVHVGGTSEEIAAAERQVWRGSHPKRPYVLVAQQSLFDETRSHGGGHTAWAYCHVPNGSQRDMTAEMEAQIERFAPGFTNRILARHTFEPRRFEAYNANYVGGDIGGGAYGISKVMQMGNRSPYRLTNDIYLCSSATSPGAGVHGMCGVNAVRAALG